MRILVCGGREYRPYAAVAVELFKRWEVARQITVIEGGCPTGADRYARDWVRTMHNQGHADTVEHLCFPADWKRYGKTAGPIRNRQMLSEGRPDIVLAFHSDITASKGTKDMVHVANEAGVPIAIFGSFMPLQTRLQ